MKKKELEYALSETRGKLLSMTRRFMKVSDIAEDAEDIVQESMAELWRLLESGYNIQNVEALAVKITKTVCVRHYRKRRILTNPIDGKEFPGGAPASGRVDLREVLDTRRELWKQLSDTQRQYLEMRSDKMMSLDEIAAATGHPKSSIKATISQARKIMKEWLKTSEAIVK